MPLYILLLPLCPPPHRNPSLPPPPPPYLSLHTALDPGTQALVYDILPPITAIIYYAIDLRKLSANEQFFVGAQMEVNLYQTTQIISDVSFITAHVLTPDKQNYNCLNQGGTFFLSFFLPGAGAPHVYVLRRCVTSIDWLIDDRLYSAILRSLEQTHCARM